MIAYFEGGPRDGEVRDLPDPSPDQILLPVPPPRRAILSSEDAPLVPPEIAVGVYERSLLRGVYLWRGLET